MDTTAVPHCSQLQAHSHRTPMVSVSAAFWKPGTNRYDCHINGGEYDQVI